MSTKGFSVGPVHYPSAPGFPLPQSPSSSFRSNHIPSYSIPPPPVPDFSRQVSNKGLYTPSIAPSVTGTSTGTALGSASGSRRKRREKEANGRSTDNKEDWAEIEPDEVFRRLQVREVKRVETKMRNEALNKQSELRAMVGARYRDLLTSATQITSLRSSSLRFSENLKQIVQSCQNPELAVENDAEDDSVQSQGEEFVQMLPAASHMKLLLDAPEALYAYLSHGAYLSAAFLWLIARVVKEGLVNMPEDASGPYLPLMQKQWETITPLRNQISQRAASSLRVWEKAEPRTTCETLLSVILLDNLPLSEALTLLLSQRSKALREILHHPPPSQTSNKTRPRAGSRAQPPNATRESITRTLLDALRCMLETASTAHLIFDKRKVTVDNGKANENGESMLDEMIRLVQKGEAVPTATTTASHPIPHKRNSGSSTTADTHQRRTSRLVSISLPMPPATSTSALSRPPVSTPEILSHLPASQILLRHLPTEITGFTPFITVSAPPHLSEALKTWQAECVGVLKAALPGWLEGLKNVSDVWYVRGCLIDLLEKQKQAQASTPGEKEKMVQDELEEEWSRRIKAIWDEKLSGVVNDVERLVKEGVKEVYRKDDEKHPEGLLFTDLALPFENTSFILSSASSISDSPLSTSVATNLNKTDPFATFRAAIQKRVARRTPVLDETLSFLEASAKSIKQDNLLYSSPSASSSSAGKGLSEELYKAYGEKVKGILDELVEKLDAVLGNVEEIVSAPAAEDGGEDQGKGREKEKEVEGEVYVGRVALYLAKKSTFIQDLSGVNLPGATSYMDDNVVSALLEIHTKSTKKWKAAAIREALKELNPLFSEYRGSQEIRANWQGKSEGIKKEEGVVEDLVKSFVREARELKGWERMLIWEGEGEKSEQMEEIREGKEEEKKEEKMNDKGQETETEEQEKKEGKEENIQKREKDEKEESQFRLRRLSTQPSEGPEALLQSILDLSFLDLIANQPDHRSNLVSKIPAEHVEFKEKLHIVLGESLKRVQLLIYALVAHLPASAISSSSEPSTTRSEARVGYHHNSYDNNRNLLRFGPPENNKPGATAEFRSPLVVAKPGKRMGLLNIDD
ncbi:hypothetical protein I314_06642 [Cryptococcus bacillisporus CA1873]|uniref:Conserved oligomeric Golgi complex subunit 1 n=1 Tax=Cryptococcus bacillisporus CA1873 TaxID=1296111 RepID=A0ABR5B1N7_CRYGA|nr:hypothetical protein I314_06642 [Cryptococcus bacillisporus CA1873]|eukprot:KIR57503.1 hypothetical protein I314_06642 [Cryptococcus gattii CA1873]